MDCLERADGIALSGQDVGQTVQPINTPRFDLQKLAIGGAGLVKTPPVLQHGAKIAQRLGKTWRQRKRPADTCFCFLKLALPPHAVPRLSCAAA